MRLKAETLKVERALEKVRQALSGRREPVAAPVIAAESSGAAPLAAAVPHGAFEGATVAEAAIQYLKLQKRPVSSGAIGNEMAKGGFVFSSDNPTRAIAGALREWRERHGGILNLGNGTWIYTANYSQKQVATLVSKYGGKGGATTEVHATRTSKGIKQRQAAGLYHGGTRKFTEEKAEQFLELIRNGMKIGKACKVIGITYACYHTYKKAGLLEWTRGEPWPPIAKPDGDNEPSEPAPAERPNLRVVS